MSTWHIRLEVRSGVLLLRALDLSSHNVLPYVVLLRQVKEFSDLRRSLGTEALGEGGVGQPCNVTLTLFDDDHGEDGNVGADNAPTDRFAPTFASPPNSVARMAIGKEKADAVWNKDTLLHRETLFVVATCNAEDVALPFVTNRVSWDFLRDFLVVEDTAGSSVRYEMHLGVP